MNEYAEDISLRTEQEKHFHYGENGYIAAVYTDPVHYLDSNNEWQDIDNTLKLVALSGNVISATGSGNGYYENTANSFKVRLPQALSGTSNIQLQYADHALSFRMLNTSAVSTAAVDNTDNTSEKKLELLLQSRNAADTEKKDQLLQQAVTLLPNQAAGLTYANVQQNTHLAYRIDGQKLKESIILTAPTTQQSFSFAFTYTGLTPVVQEFGAVHFYSDNQLNGEPIFIIQAPYMEDANPQEDTLCMDIDVSITPTSTGCIYTMTPEPEWLNDPTRVYPITIDPTATTSTDAASIQDNGVNQSDPTTNYQTVNRMYVGSNVSNGSAYESRIYIRFPRVSAIKTSAFIASAVMSLDHYPVADWQTADKNTLDVYEVPSNCAWNTADITWQSQANYNFTNRVTSYVTDAGMSAGHAVITSLVRKWYNTTAGNNGLVIKPRTVYTNKTNRTCYYSSDCDISNAGKRPRIQIIYWPDYCDLFVPLYGQEKSYWCWAACAQMLAEYYGYEQSQTNIVTYVKGDTDNEWAPDWELIEALEYATSRTTNGTTTHLNFAVSTTHSEDLLYQKLKSGHPVIISVGGVVSSRHAMVLVGYEDWGGDNLLIVNDPDPVGSGRVRTLNYESLANSLTPIASIITLQ